MLTHVHKFLKKKAIHYISIMLAVARLCFVQCFNAVGWVTGRASSRYKSVLLISNWMNREGK